MVLPLEDLPPPVIFTHAETLHAISLPPLAQFLVSLRQPQHLLKLHDILERYRTPRSYHRVDVRLVESSELPLGSPDSSQEQGIVDGPVELPEGMEVEAYMEEDQRGMYGDFIEESHDFGQNDGIKESQVPGEAPPSPYLDTVPSVEPAINPDAIHTNTSSPASMIVYDKTAALEANLADQASPLTPPPTTPPQVRAPSPPTPSHSLPPSGPTRRVRELRLDLRTLDAAALFALETWRREVLGLEKLNMDVPDSIWYKDPTPTPTPSPSPPPSVVKPQKKVGRGRPKKYSRPEEDVRVVGDGGDDLLATDLNVDGDVDVEMTEEQVEGYKSLVDALHQNGTLKQPETQPRVHQSLVHQPDDEPPTPDMKSTTDETQEIAREAGPSKHVPSPPLPQDTPSPDVVLDDAYNEKETDDPDFVPPQSSSPKRGRRPRRSKNGVAAFDVGGLAAAEEGVQEAEKKASPQRQVTFDISHESTGGPSNSPATKSQMRAPGTSMSDYQAGSGIGIVKQSRELVTTSRPPPTRELVRPFADASIPFDVNLESGKSKYIKKKKQVLDGIELPRKKARKSEEPLKQVIKTNTQEAQAKQYLSETTLEAVPDMQEKRKDTVVRDDAVLNDDDSDEEEWGFLRGIK
ncbi:hypothetical protein IAR55_001461 [Kwoniella newhampshirensis]|uniref:Uncharacterized protein n=1 Tax=Kwoniella newhampshirensis TaxID=1651941 RepID=A0AAW0Z270_9TREE